ncbi:DUF4006 family protein [Halioxenophilus sp. WMMB6]|uniref:DUF4006 family protein n=1 Tax=Halioxenophilus sp. WMMB6 TaxID=3073815 RepID=UPI00295E3EA7|nr:DUF4006 family protein [Halioxenophilus sp. WMMB6]
MFYNLMTIVLVAIGVLIGFFAAKVLFRHGWITGWLRGMGGILLLFCAVVFALSALDFFSYKAIVAEKAVATLEFTRKGEQVFRTKMITTDGKEYYFDMHGDQWQLDARIIKWPDTLAAMGVKPAYRLERLSGRYYSWEKELNEPRSVYPLDENYYGLDIWKWSQKLNLSDIGIDATYGSATYLPMADGALYEVALTRTGLIARPFNKVAEDAINRWN